MRHKTQPNCKDVAERTDGARLATDYSTRQAPSFYISPGLETGYSPRQAPYFLPFTRTRDRLQYKTGSVFFAFHED
ncbi:hypothetical protein RRG08_055846 [Elysia crispata]|uniref:Uncharacterized protein n=1 Tax=Elysia crispata TaxID=231223 RepID=A0AAE1E5M1_9GAST|nr:hypothetical protein RRG08_055846 [Elysia crispata]